MKKHAVVALSFFTSISIYGAAIEKVDKSPDTKEEKFQRLSDDTYTIAQLRQAHSLAERHKKEWVKFVEKMDEERVSQDKAKFGAVHDDDYFGQLHLPLLLAAKEASSKFGSKYLNVTQCPHTAVDVFPFVHKDNKYKLIAIGKYIARLKREKYASVGGITEYGETFEQTGVREAEEEAHLKLNPESLVLLGANSSPIRDPRGRHITSIFYGCITDQLPQPSDEAQSVYLMTQEDVESTKAEDWCARDHRKMALTAFLRLAEIINQNETS
jgi:ADP-ribose pyrophosphatase YjhB (NUDIX family)